MQRYGDVMIRRRWRGKPRAGNVGQYFPRIAMNWKFIRRFANFSSARFFFFFKDLGTLVLFAPCSYTARHIMRDFLFLLLFRPLYDVSFISPFQVGYACFEQHIRPLRGRYRRYCVLGWDIAVFIDRKCSWTIGVDIVQYLGWRI